MPVYFIRAGHDGLVKIGYAANVNLRLVKIQSDSEKPVFVINQIDGDRAAERWAHQRFDHLRVRGEWFEYDPAMHTVQSEMEGAEMPPPPPKVSHQPKPTGRAKDVTVDFDELREAFGNPYNLADALGLPFGNVYRWFREGRMPHWRVPAVMEALEKRRAA